jgi:TetR/AcrR family transcriptional regulator, transcriptional repressor for nem operon
MPRPSRKNELLDAGIATVLAQGAAQTTVDLVCAKVGVTKGAFFHHFQDKDAFVAEMLRNFGERGAAALAAVDLQALPSAPAHLGAYLGLLERIYGFDPWFRHGCLFLIVAQEYEPGSPIRRQCEQGLEHWLLHSTAEFARIARRSGRRPDVDERQLAEQLLFTIEGAVQVDRARDTKGSVHRALQQFERYAGAALHLV